MKSKITTSLAGLCFCLSLNAQIKIGNNPEHIDPVSVLELESDKRVLVVTRVSSAQMNGIVPLEGAITYNTDTKCLHYYDGRAWQILGEGAGLRITAEAVEYQTPSVLVTQIGGNANLEVGEIAEDHLPEQGIGGSKLRNRSVSGEKLEAGSVGNTELRDGAVGERAINFNELTLNDFRNDSGFITAGDVLSKEPGNVLTDRGGIFYDDSALQEELTSLASAIAGLLDGGAENEIQLLSLEGALLSITSGNSIDLSPVLSAGTDDQNLNGALLNGNILRIEIEDGSPAIVDLSSLEEGQNNHTAAQISFVPTGNTLSSNVQEALEEVQMEIDGISAGGNANPTDELQQLLLNNTVLSLSPQSAGVGSVDLDPIFVSETELEAMDFADADADPTNELQELTSTDGSVRITPSGNNFDLSVSGGGSDDQDLTSAILTGTSLTISIENGASVVADLGTLATDTELAQLNINDADADPSNELQELTSSDGSVRITPSGNNFDLSVSGGGSDDQDLTSAILTGTSLTIGIENGASVVADLGALATDTELAQLNINDADADPSNELQELTSSDGSVTITPSGNNFDLSVSGGGSDDQDLTSAILTGTSLTIGIENGAAVVADLGTLATDTELAQLNINDADADPSNELQELTSSDGSVTITPSGNNFDLSVSGGGSDDQDLTSAILTGTSLTISIEDGAAVVADLGTLATDTELAQLNINDADADPSNELQELTSSDGSVTITPSGNNFDLSVSGGGSDDQDLTSAILTGTSLTIGIENGASVVADLGALATDTELAQLNINDADADPLNEIQNISSPDGSVLVNQAGNDFELSVAGLAEGTNLANSDLTQTGGDRLYHLDGQNLSFSGSGSIGMGTENPQSKLHVSGEVRSSGYANSNGVASEPSYAFTNDADTGMWRGPNVNYLRFSTAGIEALTINPDQNVGIGTGNPAERLHVIGNILASGTITPDYVFEAYYEGNSPQNPEYRMADLKEVEAFIKNNHHLPGVPSAREVTLKGGILVNHATMINLEKIEELFLYTIRQEKLIHQLLGDLDRIGSELELLKKNRIR